MSAAAASKCTPEAFEQRYREQPDPWHFATSAYERTRYERTLAALSGSRYDFGFEPGCSIGELTAHLAPLCDRLFAIDVSSTAVARARKRCDSYPNVRIECADVRDVSLETRPDLIVLSEMGYYFDSQTLAELALRLGTALHEGGTLIAVHWLGDSTDHLLHGDEVHAALLQTLPLRHDLSERHDGFRLDRWRQP
jgi:SAM-dependent methyltransferase